MLLPVYPLLYQPIATTVLTELLYLFMHYSAGFPCHDAQVSEDALDDDAANDTLYWIASHHS